MSLRVWLPLNKDIRNQGTKNVTVTNNGVTFSNAYATFSDGTSATASRGIDLNTNFTWLGTKRSICAWVRPKGAHLHYTGAIASSGNWNTANGRWCFGVKQNNDGFIGFDTEYASGVNTTIPVNEWTHLCVTVEDSVTKFYKNGIYIGTRTTSGTGNLLASDANNTMIGRETYAGGYFSFNGDIYDVRIYDHTLSSKEVAEIAKGCILHYDFDNPYLEPTINLGKTSINYSTYNYGQEYALSGWGGDAGTVTYYSSGGYGNGPYKVYHKTATGSGGVYRKTVNDIVIEAGKTYTMSVYVKASRDYYDSGYSFNINGVTANDSNHYIYGNGVHFTTEWTRITHTFTATEADVGTYGEMSIIYNDAVTDYYVYWSCFQIEEKDHATEFTLNSRGTNIIHDNSGFNNDGTINGSLVVKSESGRNSYSVQFNGSDNSVKIGNFSTMVPDGSFTFNCWFKKITGEWSSKGYETIFGGPSGFELEAKRSSTNSPEVVLWNWGKGSFVYDLDKWNMVTFSRNTSETKLYLNGELKATGTAGTIPSGDYFIGAWQTATQQNYRGQLSDIRIYNKVLSATEILDLYQTSAVVDKNENMHCYEINEQVSNMLVNAEHGIASKQWKGGLSSYTQSNCQCTLTDDGYRIYRTPNVNPTDNGNTMWGGFVLDNGGANNFGLQKGHTYVIQFDIKGQTSNAISDTGWHNLVGWDGGGLIPYPSNIKIVNPVTANYQSSEWKTFTYKFTINDDIFKVCTTSYSSFVQGQTYISYKGFKYGFSYTNTGSLGTDLYIKNLRMYDLTTGQSIDVKKSGVAKTVELVEYDGDIKFLSAGTIECNEINEF